MPLISPIDTERLTLRCYEPADGDLLFKISQRNLDHWKRFESQNILYNISNLSSARRIARQLESDWLKQRNYFVAVFERSSNEYAGQIYVGPQNKEQTEFEIGYVVDVDHEGKGYISEAVKAVTALLFTRTEAVQIVIYCSDANPRSARVAERCGFRLFDHIRFENQPIDEISLVFVLTKEDWQKSHKDN